MSRADQAGNADVDAEEGMPAQVRHTRDDKEHAAESRQLVAGGKRRAPGGAANDVPDRMEPQESDRGQQAGVENGVPRGEECFQTKVLVCPCVQVGAAQQPAR